MTKPDDYLTMPKKRDNAPTLKMQVNNDTYQDVQDMHSRIKALLFKQQDIIEQIYEILDENSDILDNGV